jgi:hypothetical protein
MLFPQDCGEVGGIYPCQQAAEGPIPSMPCHYTRGWYTVNENACPAYNTNKKLTKMLDIYLLIIIMF